MEKELKEMLERLEANQAERKAIQDKLEAGIKANSDDVKELKDTLAEKESEIKTLSENIKKMDAISQDLQAKMQRNFSAGAEKIKSAGEAFVESEQFKSAVKSGSMRVDSVDVKGFLRKDLSGGGTAGLLVEPFRDPEIYRSSGVRPLRVRDLFPTIKVTSNAVTIVRMAQGMTPAAAQGTTAGVGKGELVAKQKADLTFESVTLPIATIANYVIASRQILSDAPMLQGTINTELVYSLDVASDNQLLLGDGTGQNISGVLNDAGINDAGSLPSGTTASGAAYLDQIRKAVTMCQTYEYYNINGVILNPKDLETIELSKGTDGKYLLVPYAATSEGVNLTPRIWRIPVVVTNAMPQGQFLLGDFNIGAKLYDREDTSIRISESHEDLFVKNGVVILAEERYTLGVNRPKAFAKGSFLAGAEK